jgi:hypothetical protein
LSFAHSGRTDGKGGHHDNINGGYHYHHGYPAHDHPNGTCPYKEGLRENGQKQTTISEKFVSSAFLGFIFGSILSSIILLILFFVNKEWASKYLSVIMWGSFILTSILFFITMLNE